MKDIEIHMILSLYNSHSIIEYYNLQFSQKISNKSNLNDYRDEYYSIDKDEMIGMLYYCSKEYIFIE